MYICTSKASTKEQILTLLLRSVSAGLSLAVVRALMLRQYLYICTSKASKLSTCRAESGGCACAAAAERVDAGAQFTCFTGTNVHILTLLLRSASMQRYVSFMQCHGSCIRHSTNTFVQLVKRQYLYFCTNTLKYKRTNTSIQCHISFMRQDHRTKVQHPEHGRSQFTCFTSTNIQILTHLLRMQCHVSHE